MLSKALGKLALKIREYILDMTLLMNMRKVILLNLVDTKYASGISPWLLAKKTFNICV
jgi:hypothetical protein